MDRQLSIEQLAERTGQGLDRLREWRSLSLIGSADGEGFGYADAERVRLIQLFLRRGIDLQTIAEAARGPVFSRSLSGYLEKFASAAPGAVYSLTEAAERLGLDEATLRKSSANSSVRAATALARDSFGTSLPHEARNAVATHDSVNTRIIPPLRSDAVASSEGLYGSDNPAASDWDTKDRGDHTPDDDTQSPRWRTAAIRPRHLRRDSAVQLRNAARSSRRQTNAPVVQPVPPVSPENQMVT